MRDGFGVAHKFCQVTGFKESFMTIAKNGDWVFVHYVGKFESGEEFDSSRRGGPIDFILGAGELIEGFDKNVEGMKIGDKKDIVVTPAEGYGEYDDEQVMTVEREMFGEDFEPEIDEQLALQMENGQRMLATITDFDDNEVTLDMNHPMAGKTLYFELELMDVKDASEKPASFGCGSSCSSCSGCG